VKSFILIIFYSCRFVWFGIHSNTPAQFGSWYIIVVVVVTAKLFEHGI
jgi:hypothetical protein